MDRNTNEGPGRDDDRKVRIGDAEREQVLNALQEHLAAGRLTVDEYEQRAEQVVGARYAEDLVHLTADLPPTEAEQERMEAERPPWQQWQGRLPFPMPLMIGLVVLAIIALPGPPFLLFPLLWIGLFFAFARLWGGPRWGPPGRWDRGGWDRGWDRDRHGPGPRGGHRQVV